MQRTTPRVRQTLGARVAALEGDNPEWGPWLALLRELERALGESGEGGPPVDVRLPAVRADGAPLLHDADIVVDVAHLSRWLGRLTAAAASDGATALAQYRPAPDAAIALVAATI
ncbi:MAG: hypothetical protein ACREMV_00535, partial [Gemmatimonadales bacterium]